MNTLSGLQLAGGVTPLAHAIRGAVDALVAHRPTTQCAKDLLLCSASDDTGSPPTSECAGPSGGNHEPQTWQWKVLNKLRTADAQNPQVPPPGQSVIRDFSNVMSPPIP